MPPSSSRTPRPRITVEHLRPWLEKIIRLRSHQRNGIRAPHKPLLLLFALGRLQRTGSTKVTFNEAEGPLRDLLREFGPARGRLSAEYPFYHLVSDGLWVLSPIAEIRTGMSPTRRQLLDADAAGQLVPELEGVLRASGASIVLMARMVLDRNFPPSLHPDICAAVGLRLEGIEDGVKIEG